MVCLLPVFYILRIIFLNKRTSKSQALCNVQLALKLSISDNLNCCFGQLNKQQYWFRLLNVDYISNFISNYFDLKPVILFFFFFFFFFFLFFFVFFLFCFFFQVWDKES